MKTVAASTACQSDPTECEGCLNISAAASNRGSSHQKTEKKARGQAASRLAARKQQQNSQLPVDSEESKGEAVTEQAEQQGCVL